MEQRFTLNKKSFRRVNPIFLKLMLITAITGICTSAVIVLCMLFTVIFKLIFN